MKTYEVEIAFAGTFYCEVKAKSKSKAYDKAVEKYNKNIEAVKDCIEEEILRIDGDLC